MRVPEGEMKVASERGDEDVLWLVRIAASAGEHVCALVQ